MVFRFSLLVSTLLESIRHLIREEKKVLAEKKKLSGGNENSIYCLDSVVQRAAWYLKLHHGGASLQCPCRHDKENLKLLGLRVTSKISLDTPTGTNSIDFPTCTLTPTGGLSAQKEGWALEKKHIDEVCGDREKYSMSWYGVFQNVISEYLH